LVQLQYKTQMNILLKYIYIQFIIAMLYLDDRNNVIYVCVKDGTL
jgi:hypothetical protein